MINNIEKLAKNIEANNYLESFELSLSTRNLVLNILSGEIAIEQAINQLNMEYGQNSPGSKC